MASRDRSQGFAFVYVDIKKLLSNPSAFQEDAHTPVDTGDAEVVSVDRAVEAAIEPQTETVVEEKRSTSANPALTQIKDNLDRLQSLHHKLHAMLAELNQITGTPKKKKT